MSNDYPGSEVRACAVITLETLFPRVMNYISTLYTKHIYMRIPRPQVGSVGKTKGLWCAALESCWKIWRLDFPIHAHIHTQTAESTT